MPDKDESLHKPIIYPTIQIRMNLKAQLNFYLKNTGMTASALARKAGVPKQSISGWLSGSNPRDVRQVKRVADVLGVTVDNLMFGNGAEHQSERTTELEALLGDQWISGLFEVRFRRIKR